MEEHHEQSAETQTWTSSEAAKWELELADRMSRIQCGHCGSNKITKSLRGKPYMPYVEWSRWKGAQLGWEPLSLSGCTRKGENRCNECGQNPSDYGLSAPSGGHDVGRSDVPADAQKGDVGGGQGGSGD